MFKLFEKFDERSEELASRDEFKIELAALAVAVLDADDEDNNDEQFENDLFKFVVISLFLPMLTGVSLRKFIYLINIIIKIKFL